MATLFNFVEGFAVQYLTEFNFVELKVEGLNI